MENEAYFVYVVHSPNCVSNIVNHKEELVYSTVVRRASIRRNLKGDEKYARIEVDFDPLGKQLAYVVMCFFDSNDGSARIINFPRPAGVFENLVDANIFKNLVDQSKHKEYADKKEQFNHSEVLPILITQM